MDEGFAATIRLSDYDHENERHVEIWVWPDLKVQVDRRIETNSDFLAKGAPPPDDWHDACSIQFGEEEELISFVTELASELLQACFSYFDEDDEEIDDSDDSRVLIANALAQKKLSSPGGEPSQMDLRDKLKELLDFPR